MKLRYPESSSDRMNPPVDSASKTTGGVKGEPLVLKHQQPTTQHFLNVGELHCCSYYSRVWELTAGNKINALADNNMVIMFWGFQTLGVARRKKNSMGNKRWEEIVPLMWKYPFSDVCRQTSALLL